MDKETAKKILAAASTSRSATWRRRDPSEAMKAVLGTSCRSFIEMPRDGKYALEVLAQDYESEPEELREAHLQFILLAAEHFTPLLTFWLQHNPPE